MKIDLDPSNKIVEKDIEIIAELKAENKLLRNVLTACKEILNRYYIETFPMYMKFLKDAVEKVDNKG